MAKKALISGVSGQDGSYLTELLLEKGYDVHGIVRRHSVAEDQSTRLLHTNSSISTYYGDMLDEHSIYRIVQEVKPDVVYNLAAMSHVRISFDIPAFTIKTVAYASPKLLKPFNVGETSCSFQVSGGNEPSS